MHIYSTSLIINSSNGLQEVRKKIVFDLHRVGTILWRATCWQREPLLPVKDHDCLSGEPRQAPI